MAEHPTAPLPAMEVEPPQPPLPPEDPPPEAPRPPMPTPVSNQKQGWLDFASGDGGQSSLQDASSGDEPAAKRVRFDSDPDITQLAAGDFSQSEQTFNDNLTKNIQVAEAMLEAIANEINSAENSPSSVEEGEWESSDNEPAAAAGITPAATTVKQEVVTQEVVSAPHEGSTATAVTAGPSDVKAEPGTQSADVEMAEAGNVAQGEHVEGARDFCPFDVGSQRRPASQIPDPEAPPGIDRE